MSRKLWKEFCSAVPIGYLKSTPPQFRKQIKASGSCM